MKKKTQISTEEARRKMLNKTASDLARRKQAATHIAARPHKPISLKDIFLVFAATVSVVGCWMYAALTM